MMFYLYLVLFMALYKLYTKITCGMCKCNSKLFGKVAIITGANTGIGFETAKDLARRGARVILACRDELKGSLAVKQIICETSNKEVIFKKLDLASLKSVREFAKDIISTESKLHILINNAGTGKLDNSTTEDNLPIEMQVNHFSPFLLTNLLLPILKSSAPSRIINVSSVMHWLGKVDVSQIDKKANNYLAHSRVYSNSKLANILITKHLHKLLEKTSVTVNCLHPGAVNTEIFRNQPAITRFFIGLIFKTPWEGAQTSIYLAVSPDVEGVSGKYFSDCKEASVSKACLDDGLASKLWEVSERLVQL